MFPTLKKFNMPCNKQEMKLKMMIIISYHTNIDGDENDGANNNDEEFFLFVLDVRRDLTKISPIRMQNLPNFAANATSWKTIFKANLHLMPAKVNL